MTDIYTLNASNLFKLYRKKKISPVDVAEYCIKQISKYNPLLNALCLIDEESALKQAYNSEQRFLKGTELGALDGIPYTVKDLVDIAGYPTRYGSKTSSPSVKSQSHPTVLRLQESGGIFLGKTNAPEFGYKGVTDSLLMGTTCNPWNKSKTSGGSSGGAAVCAATHMGFLHLGSDAGGSIRIPSSFCGVFGLKPSQGLVPSYPFDLFSSLSASGPITRTVQDAALMMDVITKQDHRDWYAQPYKDNHFFDTVTEIPKNLKIAYIPTLKNIHTSKNIHNCIQKAVKKCYLFGDIDEIQLDIPNLIDVFNTHWMVIANDILSRIPKEKYKDIDKGLLKWGDRAKDISLADYTRAQLERAYIGEKIYNILSKYDIILMPTTPIEAFDINQNAPRSKDGSIYEDWTPFTYIANLTKIPAATIPCGFTPTSMPVGLQIMGRYLNDKLVLQFAHAFENLSPHSMPNFTETP